MLLKSMGYENQTTPIPTVCESEESDMEIRITGMGSVSELYGCWDYLFGSKEMSHTLTVGMLKEAIEMVRKPKPVYTYVPAWLYKRMKEEGYNMKYVRQFKPIPPFK